MNKFRKSSREQVDRWVRILDAADRMGLSQEAARRYIAAEMDEILNPAGVRALLTYRRAGCKFGPTKAKRPQGS